MHENFLQKRLNIILGVCGVSLLIIFYGLYDYYYGDLSKTMKRNAKFQYVMLNRTSALNRQIQERCGTTREDDDDSESVQTTGHGSTQMWKVIDPSILNDNYSRFRRSDASYNSSHADPDRDNYSLF